MRFPLLVLPDKSPDEPCFECIHVNREWINILVSLVERLEFAAAWQRDTPRDRVLRDVFTLTAMLVNASGECGDKCFEFLPNAPFIEWFPHDPFSQPDVITEGYLAPAWYVANQTEKVVMTDLSRFPPGSLPTILPASGLPRFRVRVNGPGKLALHLVSIVGGSLAQITMDDDPLTVEFVDLNKDILSIPPETAENIIVEREIPEGEHHFDIIIVSWVNEVLPFIHHGGGLRKVVICGEGAAAMAFKLRQNETNPCWLEQSIDGGETWELAFDYSRCISSSLYRFNENWELEKSTDGGETWEPAPQDDPRKTATILPRDSLATECDAASSVVKWAQDNVSQLLGELAEGATVSVVVSVLLLLLMVIGMIGSAGLLAPLLVSFGGLIMAVGYDGLNNAFTPDVWEELLCAVRCGIGDDLAFSEAEFANLLNRIQVNIGGVAADHLVYMFRLVGIMGLTNAARLGLDSGLSCDDCECYTCQNTMNILYYWNDIGWEHPDSIGTEHRHFAGTPVGQYDSRRSVDGVLQLAWTESKRLKKVRVRIDGSSSGWWLSCELFINGASQGIRSSKVQTYYWDWAFSEPLTATHIRFEARTWNVSNDSHFINMTLTECVD